MHQIQISKVMRGYLVTVGCQTLIYANDETSQLTKDLAEYLENPTKKQHEMYSKYLDANDYGQPKAAPVLNDPMLGMANRKG